MLRSMLGAVVVTLAACSANSDGAPSGRGPTVAAPSPTVSGDLVQFQPRHHFLYFVVDDGELVFSGGDPVDTSSSPEIYRANPRTGSEELVAKATEPNMTILMLASVQRAVVFVESAPTGRVIYRIRSHVGTTDTVLDELVVDNVTEQQQYRAMLALPMMATDGKRAAWVSARLVDGRPEYQLMTSELDGAGARSLYRSPEWLGYPRVAGDVVFFTRSFTDPVVFSVDRQGARPAVRYASGHSESATYADRVVTKFGGAGALAPGGISLWLDPLRKTDLAPADAHASDPSINERYVVWWGPTDRVAGYDWRAGQPVILGRPLVDDHGKSGVVGRQAAFPGVVVWLATVPGDLHETANLKPYFEFLFVH